LSQKLSVPQVAHFNQSSLNVSPNANHISNHSSAMKQAATYAGGMTDDEYGEEPDDVYEQHR